MTSVSAPSDRLATSRCVRRGRGLVLAVIVALLVVATIAALSACGSGAGSKAAPPAPSASAAAEITFIDLGSVGCAPCKAMQSIMDGVERDYGERVAVVFYDVNENPDAARDFGVQMIPTQVFLDADGVEFYRHVGVLPREEIDALLAERGVTPVGQ